MSSAAAASVSRRAAPRAAATRSDWRPAPREQFNASAPTRRGQVEKTLRVCRRLNSTQRQRQKRIENRLRAAAKTTSSAAPNGHQQQPARPCNGQLAANRPVASQRSAQPPPPKLLIKASVLRCINYSLRARISNKWRLVEAARASYRPFARLAAAAAAANDKPRRRPPFRCACRPAGQLAAPPTTSGRRPTSGRPDGHSARHLQIRRANEFANWANTIAISLLRAVCIVVGCCWRCCRRRLQRRTQPPPPPPVGRVWQCAKTIRLVLSLSLSHSSELTASSWR